MGREDAVELAHCDGEKKRGKKRGRDGDRKGESAEVEVLAREVPEIQRRGERNKGGEEEKERSKGAPECGASKRE